jgi:NAD(P)-dependent dehydrogenase (short-subunit alcohol dehydrogenase family)
LAGWARPALGSTCSTVSSGLWAKLTQISAKRAGAVICGLILRAGKPAFEADMDAVRSALEVDVIGPWALTQAMLPLLIATPAARIVNVSSLSALQVATGLDLGASLRAPAYSMAKHMLNALTTVLARALEDTPILVNAVDPGNTATHPERGEDPTDRPAAESARDVVRAATLGPDGPTGVLFGDGQRVA